MIDMPRFGKQGYNTLLADLAAAGYNVRPADQIDDSDRTCWLRHDVDIHLDGCLAFARMEREYGARSCWMVPVTFCFNVMHGPNRQILRNLVALGHTIGLHYDIDHTPTLSDLHHQVRVLEAAAGTRVHAITAHKPGHSKRGLRQSAYREPYHPEYVSDSARRWRDDRLMRLVHERESFMLCTHVEHWMSAAPELTEHFTASVLPNTVRQAHEHAMVTLNDCITHT